MYICTYARRYGSYSTHGITVGKVFGDTRIGSVDRLGTVGTHLCMFVCMCVRVCVCINIYIYMMYIFIYNIYIVHILYYKVYACHSCFHT